MCRSLELGWSMNYSYSSRSEAMFHGDSLWILKIQMALTSTRRAKGPFSAAHRITTMARRRPVPVHASTLDKEPSVSSKAKPAAKKNSLFANINKRKKAGKSRSKKKSTVDDADYKKIKMGWK